MMYFDEKNGITSTSANYLANLAKEEIKKNEAKLANVSFVNKNVELISSTNYKPLRRGWKDITAIPTMLAEIANLNAFSAWMREAIKAKEELLKQLDHFTVEDYCKIKGIEYPESFERKQYVTEEDIIAEMNTKSRNNYLRIEAFAATFGKYIHPDGKISLAREEALYREQVPNEVSGDGRDMVIYSYESSIETSKVDDLFMKLQSNQREYEKQLNAIKFQIKEEVTNRNLAIDREYKEKMEERFRILAKLQQETRIYVNEKRNEIASLKIIVPEKLQDTYTYLNSLGD